MSQEMPASHLVDGFRLPARISPEDFRSVVQYKPRDDDIFLVTYPKCGTNWTMHMVHLIFRQGKPAESLMEILCASPFLLVTGAKAAETMPRPGLLQFHLPFHLAPWSDKAKYIYVTRNPKDCCVSFYNHMKNFHRLKLMAFDQFFELFLSGKIEFGDYFDHLMGWYEHRNAPNVLFITYEEMKENPEASILKLATFIDEEKYAKPLLEDPEKLQNILKYSSFEYMKETVNKGVIELSRMPEEEISKYDLPAKAEKLIKFIRKVFRGEEKSGTPPAGITFVRKGIVGDWKNYFNEDQSRRLDEKFAVRTKGTDLPTLWKDYM